jgi:hypothetical protein
MAALESEMALKVTEKRPLGMDDLRERRRLCGLQRPTTAPSGEARDMPPNDLPVTGTGPTQLTTIGFVS